MKWVQGYLIALKVEHVFLHPAHHAHHTCKYHISDTVDEVMEKDYYFVMYGFCEKHKKHEICTKCSFRPIEGPFALKTYPWHTYARPIFTGYKKDKG